MNAPTPTVLQEDLNLLVPASELHRPSPIWGHWAVGASLAVVLLIGYLAIRRRSQATKRSERQTDPGETALGELSAWSNLTDPSRYREAVTAISATLRRYVENRFGLGAPRLTTEEFWAQLRATRPMPPAFDPFWETFLGACDEIKYAGYTPDALQFQRLLHAATDFVQVAERAGR